MHIDIDTSHGWSNRKVSIAPRIYLIDRVDGVYRVCRRIDFDSKRNNEMVNILYLGGAESDFAFRMQNTYGACQLKPQNFKIIYPISKCGNIDNIFFPTYFNAKINIQLQIAEDVNNFKIKFNYDEVHPKG